MSIQQLSLDSENESKYKKIIKIKKKKKSNFYANLKTHIF